jgi:hypothetical protein
MPSIAYILGAGFSQAFGFPSTEELLSEILAYRHPRWTTFNTTMWQDKIQKYLKVNYLGYPTDSLPIDIVQLMNHIDRGDELRTIFQDRDEKSTFAYHEFWTVLTRLMSTYFLTTSICLMYPPDELLDPLRSFLRKLRSSDIIITLNWDSLLEHAFELIGESNAPIIQGKVSEGKVSVYKLHGSIDYIGTPNEWMEKYWKEFEPMEIGQDQPMWRIRTYDRQRGWKPEMPWELTEREPLLLAPPADVQHLRNPFMKQMWRNAFEHAKECDEFVVIGYSLPRDDYFIQMMLSSLYRHYHKRKNTRIRVVDPDPHGDVERNWKLSFGQCVEMIRSRFEVSPYCE